MSEPNLYKRNGIWWLRATIDGREIRESLRCRDLKAARRIRDSRLEQFAQARSGLPQTSWKEAVTLWADHITGQILPSTAKRYAVSLLQCEPWLGNLPLSEIKSSTISEMARARKTAGASAATIRRDLPQSRESLLTRPPKVFMRAIQRLPFARRFGNAGTLSNCQRMRPLKR